MKFEAKNDGYNRAVSQESGSPWTQITAFSAQRACESLQFPHFQGRFTLISNPEWMTIARQIENNPLNWSGKAIGQGHLPRGQGHSHQHLSTRTFILLNNEVLFDFAGGVWEWVDWRLDVGFTYAPKNTPLAWHNFPLLKGSLSADDLLPLGPYTTAHSAGRWFGGSGGAAIRGGAWHNGTNRGVFALSLHNHPLDKRNSIGFRCVYRPNPY